MARKISGLGLILSSSPYLRSGKAWFPLNQASFHQVKGVPTLFLEFFQFVTPFTHVLDLLELGIKNKKKLCQKNCFDYVVSDL